MLLLRRFAQGVISTLWLSDIPVEFKPFVDFASKVTEVLNVLPPRNVSNFLVADLLQPLPDFSNLRIKDADPVQQALVSNLVPIAGGLQNTGTMLINLWNSQEVLFKTR